MAVIDQTEVQLKCVTSPGKPAATVTWLSSSVVERRTSEKSVLENTTNGLIIVKSTLTHNVTKEDNGRRFTCTASNIPNQTKTAVSGFFNILGKTFFYCPKGGIA